MAWLWIVGDNNQPGVMSGEGEFFTDSDGKQAWGPIYGTTVGFVRASTGINVDVPADFPVGAANIEANIGEVGLLVSHYYLTSIPDDTVSCHLGGAVGATTYSARLILGNSFGDYSVPAEPWNNPLPTTGGSSSGQYNSFYQAITPDSGYGTDIQQAIDGTNVSMWGQAYWWDLGRNMGADRNIPAMYVQEQCIVIEYTPTQAPAYDDTFVYLRSETSVYPSYTPPGGFSTGGGNNNLYVKRTSLTGDAWTADGAYGDIEIRDVNTNALIATFPPTAAVAGTWERFTVDGASIDALLTQGTRYRLVVPAPPDPPPTVAPYNEDLVTHVGSQGESGGPGDGSNLPLPAGSQEGDLAIYFCPFPDGGLGTGWTGSGGDKLVWRILSAADISAGSVSGYTTAPLGHPPGDLHVFRPPRSDQPVYTYPVSDNATGVGSIPVDYQATLFVFSENGDAFGPLSVPLTGGTNQQYGADYVEYPTVPTTSNETLSGIQGSTAFALVYGESAAPPTPSSGGSLSLDVALAGAGVIPPISRSGTGSITASAALAGAGQVVVPTADGTGSLSLDVALAGAGELVTPSKTGTGSLSADVALAGAGEVVAPSLSGSGDLTLDISLSGAGEIVTPSRSGAGDLALDVALTGAGEIIGLSRSGSGDIAVDVALAGSGSIAGTTGSGSGALVLDVALAGSGEVVAPSGSAGGALVLDVALDGAGAIVAPSFSGGPAPVWDLTGLIAESVALDGTEVVTQQPAGIDLAWDGTKWAWSVEPITADWQYIGSDFQYGIQANIVTGYTFTNVPLGPDYAGREVIVVASVRQSDNYGSEIEVTVGGVTLTQDVGRYQQRSAVTIARGVVSGTSADITIAQPGGDPNTGNAVYHSYAVYTTPAVTLADIAQNGTTGTQNWSMSVFSGSASATTLGVIFVLQDGDVSGLFEIFDAEERAEASLFGTSYGRWEGSGVKSVTVTPSYAKGAMAVYLPPGEVVNDGWESYAYVGSGSQPQTVPLFQPSLVVFATGEPSADTIEGVAIEGAGEQYRYATNASPSLQLTNNETSLTTQGEGSSGFAQSGSLYSYLSVYAAEKGTYTGNGGTTQIVLPFTPGMVLVQRTSGVTHQSTMWVTPDLGIGYKEAQAEAAPATLVGDTLTVENSNPLYFNSNGSDDHYVAFPVPDVSGTYTGTGPLGPQTIALPQAVKFLLVMCADEDGVGPGMAWTFDAQYGDAGNYHRVPSGGRDDQALRLGVNADSFEVGRSGYEWQMNIDTATYRYYGWS